MKAAIAEPGTKVYSGTGFSATTVTELPAGSEVEVLTAEKHDGKKWISVTLDDGRTGLLPGKTMVVANGVTQMLENAYASTSARASYGKRDAKGTMTRGAAWLAGGILVIIGDVALVYGAVSSRSELSFPVKPVLLGGIVAAIYGGVRLLIGAVAYMQSSFD